VHCVQSGQSVWYGMKRFHALGTSHQSDDSRLSDVFVG